MTGLRTDEPVSGVKNSGVVPAGTAPLVFWDGYGLSNPYSGIGHYAHHLFGALVKTNLLPVIICPDQPPFFGRETSVTLRSRFPEKIWSSKLIWPIVSYSEATRRTKLVGKTSVFHGLSNINVPLTKKSKITPTVVTVHDLIPILAPALVSRAYHLQFSLAMSRLIRSVDKIVAVSEWTARSICERYPSVEGRVTVIKNGRPAVFHGLTSKASGDGTNVLTVSRFEPYKNLAAIGQIAERSDPKMTFTLVSDQRAVSFFKSGYGHLLNTGRIRLHVNPDDEQLERFYCEADCYFQPSLYEGFCLPVMKAVSYALPVAFLKGSAIDEIALPEFSVGADRNRTSDFIDAIQGAVKMRNTGPFLENAKNRFEKFATWDDAARKLKNLYTELI